ncbi:hypothetical protein OUZ56_032304, partial [Daphnia magna]
DGEALLYDSEVLLASEAFHLRHRRFGWRSFREQPSNELASVQQPAVVHRRRRATGHHRANTHPSHVPLVVVPPMISKQAASCRTGYEKVVGPRISAFGGLLCRILRKVTGRVALRSRSDIIAEIDCLIGECVVQQDKTYWYVFALLASSKEWIPPIRHN